MKKLLNVLFVTTQGSYLCKERETIVVKDGKEKLGQFPALGIIDIFCFGRIKVSTPLMGFCAERGIGVVFLSIYGRFLCRVQGKITGNVLLRREQYRWADNSLYSLSIARLVVAGKIANTRYVLQRELRNHGKNYLIEDALSKLTFSTKRVKRVVDYAELLGIEGEAANVYFSVFEQFIRNKAFVFSGRVRRPPTDPVNAMLSFVYVLLTQECVSALTAVGLDPYVGFLHKDRPGRASLALDLLEEFRPSWADRLVLTLINRKQLQKKDFITEASTAVCLTDKGRKSFFDAYQERKQEKVTHPFLDEKIPMGMLPYCQALLLARHIRGELKHYPPYWVK